MKSLPTIGQVMELVCQEEKVASAAKLATVSTPQYHSEIAKGLHEVAGILKAAETDITYEDVLSFGRGLLGRQS